MPVAIVMDFEGATLDQYDDVVDKMGYERGGPGERGGLFHWATATETGVRIVDVWETQELYEEFAQTKLGPVAAETGVPQPTVKVIPVHNHFTAGG